MIGVHSVSVTPVGGSAVDLSCFVTSVTIRHGRDDPGSQPDASTATLELVIRPDETGPLPAAVEIGATLTVVTTVTTGHTRFTGRISDIAFGWDDAGPSTPDAGVAQLVAVAPLADLGRRVVGDAPYPQELDGARVSRIMSVAGVTLNPATSDPGTVQIIARDVDSQPALDVSQATAQSASGMVWATRAGEIRYADAMHRKGIPPALTLDSCDVLVTPTWRRTTEGLTNEVSIGYGVKPASGDQPRYTATRPDSIAKYGRYGMTGTTELAAAADATALGQLLLVRNGFPVWVMAALPVDMVGLDDARTEALLEADVHSLITLTGLPAIGAAPTSASLWVEGWGETLTPGGHTLELIVSGYCRTVPAPRWDDVDPTWLWGGQVFTEARRNLLTNPSGETSAVGWAANTPANHSITEDTTMVHSRGMSRLCTPLAPIIGASTTLLSMFNLGGNPFPVTVGQAYTASVWFRHTAPAAKVQVGVSFLNAGGGAILTVLGPQVDAAPNTWVRAWCTEVAPALAVNMRVTGNVQRQGGNVAAGERAWVDDAMAEAGSSLAPYFDGATADTPAMDYSWAGTADASQSIATAITNVSSGLPADLTWDEATCIGPPINIGRWNDQPATLRWDQLDPATVWDNYGG